jgi:DNA-binding protein H-NS
MATSVSRIHAQIAKLQQQADALKQSAVKRVQREIALHGLTAEDLFGGGSSVGNGRKAKSTTPMKAKKVASTKSAKAPKYGDSAGNTWGGMGKRPKWLRDALEQGASLEDFVLGTPKSSRPTEAAPSRKLKVATKTGAKREAGQPRGAKKVVEQSPAKKAGAKRKATRAAAQPEATQTE